jgi:hypothetical protein
MVKLFKVLPALMALAGVLSLFAITRPATF